MTNPGDFDPPLTPEELDTRDLLSNPRRQRELREWAVQCRQAWAEGAGKEAVEAWESGEAGTKRRWPGRARVKRERAA